MSWTRAILPRDFRRMKHSGIPFFKNTVRFERRMRADTGYFLAYQMLEAGEIARAHYANRYQRLPSWWGNFEVCQGFWSELGPILTYFGSHLNDPRHGLWVVFLTEWCVKVAANLLWEAYDCWRLWFLPPKLVELMRLLDYSIPLGGVDSDIEVHSLLDKITQDEWDNVPAFNSSRSFTKRRPSFSPGRSHSAAGDFAWFNAWTSSFCSASEAQLSRQHGKQIDIPDTHPDPRAESVCSRPSVPSSPRPIQASVPRAQSPAPSPTGSSRPAVPSILLRSQPVPALSGAAQADLTRSEAPPRVKLPPASSTETLSILEAPPSDGDPTPRPASTSLEDPLLVSTLVPPTSSIPKQNTTAAAVYHRLLMAHGVDGEALQGASLDDLRVLPRLVTSLPKGKSLGAPSR